MNKSSTAIYFIYHSADEEKRRKNSCTHICIFHRKCDIEVTISIPSIRFPFSFHCGGGEEGKNSTMTLIALLILIDLHLVCVCECQCIFSKPIRFLPEKLQVDSLCFYLEPRDGKNRLIRFDSIKSDKRSHDKHIFVLLVTCLLCHN